MASFTIPVESLQAKGQASKAVTSMGKAETFLVFIPLLALLAAVLPVALKFTTAGRLQGRGPEHNWIGGQGPGLESTADCRRVIGQSGPTARRVFWRSAWNNRMAGGGPSQPIHDRLCRCHGSRSHSIPAQFVFRIFTYVLLPVVALLSVQFPGTLGQSLSLIGVGAPQQ